VSRETIRKVKSYETQRDASWFHLVKLDCGHCLGVIHDGLIGCKFFHCCYCEYKKQIDEQLSKSFLWQHWDFVTRTVVSYKMHAKVKDFVMMELTCGHQVAKRKMKESEIPERMHCGFCAYDNLLKEDLEKTSWLSWKKYEK